METDIQGVISLPCAMCAELVQVLSIITDEHSFILCDACYDKYVNEF